MKNDIILNNGIIIPEHELEITTSRSGGAGGQHVNKTDTRISVRWNVNNSQALNPEQKELVLAKLHNKLTIEGDLIVHNNESRSQQHNKKLALAQLGRLIQNGLHVPKKRIATHLSKTKKELRLQEKKRHGQIKKLRRTLYEE